MMIPDYIFYGKWHLLPLNFIIFNVVEGKADYFGTSPATAYIEAYIPDHLGLLYPFAIIGLLLFTKDRFRKRELMITLIFVMNLVLYSLTAHKETRYFLMAAAQYNNPH